MYRPNVRFKLANFICSVQTYSRNTVESTVTSECLDLDEIIWPTDFTKKKVQKEGLGVDRQSLTSAMP